MRFFISIISRNREALSASLVDKAHLYFSSFPTFKGVSLVQHMGTYPTLMAMKARLGNMLVLDENEQELDAVRRGLGFLRNQSIETGMDRFRMIGEDDDFVLVLDDDIELSSISPTIFFEAVRLMNSDEKAAIIQMSHKNRSSISRAPIEGQHICTTGGGTLVRLSHFLEVGGYGEDYFDTPELSIKLCQAGFHSYRLNNWFSRHNYQKEGGLKELFPHKKNCNEMRHLSRIVEE